MICYNCSNWQPDNPYTVNGRCPICATPTRADTECFNPSTAETPAKSNEPREIRCRDCNFFRLKTKYGCGICEKHNRLATENSLCIERNSENEN